MDGGRDSEWPSRLASLISGLNDRGLLIEGVISGLNNRGLLTEGVISGLNDRGLPIEGVISGLNDRGLLIEGVISGLNDRGLPIEKDTPLTVTWSPGMACRVVSPRATTVMERGMLPTGTWSFWMGKPVQQVTQPVTPHTQYM